MRRELNNRLGEELRFLAIETRGRLGYTQKEISQALYMTESSYSDIETGRCRCSMLTAILLLRMQEDPTVFWDKVEARIAKLYEDEIHLVQ